MNDNMSWAREDKKRLGSRTKILDLNPGKVIATKDMINIYDSDNVLIAEIGLEKAMALRNLLSTWGNEKRQREGNRFRKVDESSSLK